MLPRFAKALVTSACVSCPVGLVQAVEQRWAAHEVLCWSGSSMPASAHVHPVSLSHLQQCLAGCLQAYTARNRLKLVLLQQRQQAQCGKLRVLRSPTCMYSLHGLPLCCTSCYALRTMLCWLAAFMHVHRQTQLVLHHWGWLLYICTTA